jgi:hypothetical protein
MTVRINLVEVLGGLDLGVRTMTVWIHSQKAIQALEPVLVAVIVDLDIEKYL